MAATDQDFEATSTRPYLIRALHEWCCDNGFTPFITVFVDASVQVPLEFVKDDEIVLNIGLSATTALRLGNDYLEFKARFAGVVREIMVPMDHVLAIFSRESGQGMAFPKPEAWIATAPLAAQAVSRAGLSLAKTTPAMAGEKSQGDDRLGQLDEEDGSSAPLSDGVRSAKARPALTRIK